MDLNTAAAVISFARKLEEDGASLYEDAAKRHPQHADVLLGFARDNRKNITQVERAYYGAISDALEGCFSFTINTDAYAIGAEVTAVGLPGMVHGLIAAEETIKRFYLQAAAQSASLLADVPRAFMAVAKKRQDRSVKLTALLADAG